MAEVSKIDYKLGQDNVQLLGLDIHNPVFVVSSLTIIAFVSGVLVFQAGAAAAFGALRAWLMSTFDWVFMSVGNLFVLFCLMLVVTPLGRVRLGGADARPDYSRSAWFAMLFAAGIGIGLMFFGVSEPVEHFLQPPLGLKATDTAAAHLGLASAIYHWGIHGWAMYAVVALGIAFASYNLGLPMTLRSAFYPLMGDAVWGRFGHGIDTLAVFATLFGLATSLGLGAQQAAGLAHLLGAPATNNTTTQVLLIAGITSMALASVVSGMEKGVKRLSEVNLLLALLLLAFILTVGPTLDIVTGTVTSLGQYLAAIGPLSNWVGREDLDFMHGWTVFFWAWWISWSPFVGLFIARVSRGRTVRELTACMLIIPTLVAAIWMNAFGGTAVSQYVDHGHPEGIAAVQAQQPEIALFTMLETLPLANITSFLGIVLIVVFFVTSSDSGSLVIDTITAGGKLDAPVAQRVFWCVLEGIVAIALLLGGGLVAAQAATLATGLPFALVLVAMCYSTWKGLRASTVGRVS